MTSRAKIARLPQRLALLSYSVDMPWRAWRENLFTQTKCALIRFSFISKTIWTSAGFDPHFVQKLISNICRKFIYQNIVTWFFYFNLINNLNNFWIRVTLCQKTQCDQLALICLLRYDVVKFVRTISVTICKRTF